MWLLQVVMINKANTQLADVTKRWEDLQIKAAAEQAAAALDRQNAAANASSKLADCEGRWQKRFEDVQQQAAGDRAALEEQHSKEKASAQQDLQADKHQLVQRLMQKAKVSEFSSAETLQYCRLSFL